MWVTADIETDSLNPTKLWLIGCLEHDTGEYRVFLRPDLNPKPFLEYAKKVSGWVFHNGLWFDVPAVNKLLGREVIDYTNTIDTLVVSRLLNTSRVGGHSLERYGEEFDFPKIKFNDYSKLSDEMIEYAEQDVRLGHKVFEHYKDYIYSPRWREALRTEHDTAWYCRMMNENGFAFDKEKCDELLDKIDKELYIIDIEIQKAFPPRSKLIREITPSLTKNGSFHKKDFKWYDGHDYTIFTPGAPFSLIEYTEFNPASPAQIVERLNEAGWKPFEKTKSHIQAERERNQEKLERFRKTGWKVSEDNLATLPDTAPEAAKSLARRILLASRKGDLEEWLAAYNPDDGRIHGSFNSIGAWTHRASHNNPNTANIATGKSLYAHEMRGLWTAGQDRYLIGVDADGIQLRIFTHYCRDDRLVEAILKGDKALKTDIHSVNQYALGRVCKSRDGAKTYIYAFLLGAGDAKLAAVLGCTLEEAKEARKNFLEFYPGLKDLKSRVIPADAERGYFEGFDGRLVLCDSEHLMLAGYLQNGESVIMKKAKQLWWAKLTAEKIPFWLVNWVHDEWQTETIRCLDTALYIAKAQAEAIREAGEIYNVYCPLAGSWETDGPNNTRIPSIGDNWTHTH